MTRARRRRRQRRALAHLQQVRRGLVFQDYIPQQALVAVKRRTAALERHMGRQA